MAAEGAHLIDKEAHPPRWAEVMLLSLLRPADREPVSGDLLEEYRAARRPALGGLRADVWYVKHAISVLWQLVRPFASLLVAQSLLLSVTVFRPGHHAAHFHPPGPAILLLMVKTVLYGSVMPLPGVSLFDALIYFTAGYYAFLRARWFRTGMLVAAGSSLVGFVALFGSASLITPSLIGALFANPFIFVILSAYLLIPLGYAVLMGALGGGVAWCVARTATDNDRRYA